MDRISIRSHSVSETMHLAERLAKFLAPGDVIGLVGELGSGKTYFTKGLGKGLDVRPYNVISSPSFTLINEYDGRYRIFHIDFYRLDGIAEIRDIGVEEYLFSDGICVVEWADKGLGLMPEWTLWVRLFIIDEQKRDIVFEAEKGRALDIIQNLKRCSIMRALNLSKLS